MKYIYSFILILIMGCSSQLSPYEVYQYDGINAYASLIPSPKEEEVKTECKCNGTGKVKRDGNVETTCDCGPNCKCKSAEVKKEKQILFFSGPGCPPCEKVKKNTFEVLKKTGWKIIDFSGEESNGHIVIIDYTKNPELFKKYNVERMPTFIIMKGDKEISRDTGFLNANKVATLWNSGET